MTAYEPLELKNKLLSGISITEFAGIIHKPTQYASVIASRLQRRGLVSLRKDYEPRTRRGITRITLTKIDISPEELHMATFPGTGQRDNNFIAPDLTPRIRQAVDLRLTGHSDSEIADKLGISKHTVGMYLSLARHPEKYMKLRQSKEYNISPGIDQVNKLLERDGYVISIASGIPHFPEVYKHFHNTEMANCVEFPFQKKFFGSLSSSKAIYSNKKKFADFVASKLIEDVFTNFAGYRTRDGAKSYSMRVFTHSLSGTFPSDKEVVEQIRLSLKAKGLRIDNKNIIQADSLEPISIGMSEAETTRMNELLMAIQRALTSSGNVYKECKAFTNFFERTSRKHGFEPSKALIDPKSSQVRVIRR